MRSISSGSAAGSDLRGFQNLGGLGWLGEYEGKVTLIPIRDLQGLLTQACDWVRDYLTYNPNATDDQRQLCGIPPRAGR
jgi:hypothetical protein